MPTPSEFPITEYLRRAASGDAQAAEAVFTVLYDELRTMANRAMQGEPNDHTLQPTALVHEAFMRLIQGEGLEQVANRFAFFAIASRTMRNVLVDHARKRNAIKRQQRMPRVPLDDVIAAFEQLEQIELLALDEALEELQRRDDRLHQIVMLSFFGGLSHREIADHFGLSLSTIEKDWRYARCWLLNRLDSSDPTSTE